MIFTDRDTSAPQLVQHLAKSIYFDGMDFANFYAYFRIFRKNFTTDEGCCASYLTLRKQDPCKHQLSQYCPRKHAHISSI